MKLITFKKLITFLKSMKIAQKTLLSEVIMIAKWMIVVPATNAVLERSFSTLKRTKTYLRLILQEKLNHLICCCTSTKTVDSIDIINIGNEFVSKTVNCKHSLVTFNENDKARKEEFMTAEFQTNILMVMFIYSHINHIN